MCKSCNSLIAGGSIARKLKASMSQLQEVNKMVKSKNPPTSFSNPIAKQLEKSELDSDYNNFLARQKGERK